MIEIIEFSRRFGNSLAVDAIDLTIKPGIVFGLLGPNGAGKSTIVKTIVGALKPTKGSILVNGKDITEFPVETKAMIGYVPEVPYVFTNLTGQEFLTMTAQLYHVDPSVIAGRASELLGKFGITKKKDDPIITYSKGMIQKLVIVSALLHNPDIFILDEPLNGLDANAAAVLKETLRSFSAMGKTILFSSHILEVVEKLCDEIAIMDKGKILSSGTVEQILAETGCADLEKAFIKLTGRKDIEREALDIINALK
ncbi:MAG: ABC transporter ATP-binding protein [Spirochaetales bacterium]|nr:ABC transporter ATP-binding protein [Spirochaetales bacterium]